MSIFSAHSECRISGLFWQEYRTVPFRVFKLVHRRYFEPTWIQRSPMWSISIMKTRHELSRIHHTEKGISRSSDFVQCFVNKIIDKNTDCPFYRGNAVLFGPGLILSHRFTTGTDDMEESQLHLAIMSTHYTVKVYNHEIHFSCSAQNGQPFAMNYQGRT